MKSKKVWAEPLKNPMKKFEKSSRGMPTTTFIFPFPHIGFNCLDTKYSIDTDGSGKVDYTEFLAATMEKSLYMKEDKLIQAFKMLDLDDNGKISKAELKSVLCSNHNYIN